MAVLELETPIEFNDNIQAVVIPAEGEMQIVHKWEKFTVGVSGYQLSSELTGSYQDNF